MPAIEPGAGGRRRPVYIDKTDEEAYRAMSAANRTIRDAAAAAGLGRSLLELVNVRVSQLNGCACCLDVHTRAALRQGESAQRIAVLPAWRDTDLFSEAERGALALAESLTLLPAEPQRGSEEEFARGRLTDRQFSALSWAVISINGFNRMSIISRHPVRPRT